MKYNILYLNNIFIYPNQVFLYHGNRLRYRTEQEIKAVYDKLNLPCEDSYVHMTLKLSKDSIIPSCSEYFPTTKASENIKKWMDDIVKASYGTNLILY